MHWLQHYVVDWDKVKTLDDMKRLMAVMHPAIEQDAPGVEKITDLLRLVDRPPGRAVMD